MSAPISAIAKAVQVGVETTAGTVVAANRKLLALSINSTVEIETDAFRPSGFKYPTLVALGKEWTSASLEGKASYNELIYPLASLLMNPTPTQIMSSDPTPVPTGAYTWLFAPNSSSPDSVKTFTIEEGRDGAGNAKRWAHALVNELTFEWSRSGVGLTGSMFGQRTTTGLTLTASPTSIAEALVLPTQVSVYMDNTAAGLGTTKLLDTTAGTLTIGNRFSPWWTLNSANNSFASTVESEPSTDFSLRMAANSVGLGYLDAIRAGTTKFIRIEALGTRIYTGNPNVDYRMRVDLAAKYVGGASDDEEDGALVVEPGMTLVHDATWGKAFQIEIINTRATL